MDRLWTLSFFLIVLAVGLVEASLNCWPDLADANQGDCELRGCVWTDGSCVFKDNWGYKVTGGEIVVGDSGETTLEPTDENLSKYEDQMEVVKFEAVKEGPARVQLKFTNNGATDRWEIPEEIITLNPPGDTTGDALYEVSMNAASKDIFSLVLSRKGGGAKILDTTGVPGFNMEDRFIEISFKLSTENIYGFGEHHHKNFLHTFDDTYLPMFTRAHGVDGGDDKNYPNLYGAHPFFMGFDSDDEAFGVLFWNSNAQEVFLSSTDSILTYRTIGGVLDIRVMLGPTPAEVIQQYHEMIGKPYFPPYWSLGFQMSKYWYGDLDTVKAMHLRMKDARIPFDVQHYDIDYMDRQRAFTTDPVEFKGIREFTEQIQATGMRTVMILDPAMTNNETVWSGDGEPDTDYPAWVDGEADDIYIRFPDAYGGEIGYGKVWPDFPNSTKDVCHEGIGWDEQIVKCRAFSGFPDWFKDETTDWWVDQSTRFHKGADGFGEGIPFDGIWIDMNEPESFIQGSLNFEDEANGCPKDSRDDDPPYVPHLANREEGLSKNTLCLSTEVTLGAGTGDKISFYNAHSLYGYAMAKPTLAAADAATGKRSMVFSRSTFPGTGALIGHWLGDNGSWWEHLRRSVIGLLEMNIFGITYTGADICGFFQHDNDDEGNMLQVPAELCYRWMQLGAFYTFARNHATKYKPEQDPPAISAEVAEASRRVLETRYSLLPYLYTLMYEANQNGGTVLRSLMEEFHKDKETWGIDAQFLWGPALLITPVLTEGADTVTGYVPEGLWYDYNTAEKIDSTGKEYEFDSTTVDCAGDIPLLLRGGYVIPAQNPAVTTTTARTLAMYLMVALDGSGEATGNLHWDEGEDDISANKYESLDLVFSASNNKLSITATATNGYAPDLGFSKFYIYGVDIAVKSVVVGTCAVEFTQEDDMLSVLAHNYPLIHETVDVEWSTTEGEGEECDNQIPTTTTTTTIAPSTTANPNPGGAATQTVSTAVLVGGLLSLAI